MIEITIDEDACVGCGFCAKDCPTGVLSFDWVSRVPRVVKREDCVDCLSCYYVCPATAIGFAGADLCPNFYRDLETLNLDEGIL